MICRICHHCGLCEGDGTFTPQKKMYVEQSVMFSSLVGTAAAKLLQNNTMQRTDIGIAFDVGTTTIAASAYRLCNGEKLSSCGEQNLQTAFGSDVIARISFASTQEGFSALHSTVLIQLNKMVKQILMEVEGRFLSERQGRLSLQRIVIAGNTAMESFVAGVSVKGLACFPFTAGSTFGFTVLAKELFNEKSVIPADTEIYFAPIISAFVGGDTVCAMAACSLDEQSTSDEPQVPLLLADIGTNCEMAVYNPLSKKIWCTSSAAGPAFEGQGISCGMPASEGAIADVRIEHDDEKISVVCSVIGGGKAKGICGTGLLSACASFYKAGILDENGTIVCKADTADFVNEERIILSEMAILTQKDIRNFQLAKAAVASGIETIRIHSAVSTPTLFLAGGFGTALNVDDAQVTGLVPPSFTGKILSVGNASLSGAALLLFGNTYRSVVDAIVSHAVNIDLAQDEAFQPRYISALNFPIR